MREVLRLSPSDLINKGGSAASLPQDRLVGQLVLQQARAARVLQESMAASVPSQPIDHGLSLATMNIWAMPFASHAVLSRPVKLASVIVEHVIKQLPHDARCVICIQEAWGFKCGLGGLGLHLARRFEERCPSWFTTSPPSNTFDESQLLPEVWKLNSCCTLSALLCALVTSFCCPLTPLTRYDEARETLRAALRPHGLLHATGMRGAAGLSSAKMMDSGLLILSNQAPLVSGFVGYEPPLAEEAGVHKGVLWALFSGGAAGSELVVTTHMHATSDEIRAQQRLQLSRLITELRGRHHPALVVLCGDLNEEPERLGELSASAPLGLRRLSETTPEGTCIHSDGSTQELDHVLAVADAASGLELDSWLARPPVRTLLSDHSLLIVSGISVRQAEADATEARESM